MAEADRVEAGRICLDDEPAVLDGLVETGGQVGLECTVAVTRERG